MGKNVHEVSIEVQKREVQTQTFKHSVVFFGLFIDCHHWAKEQEERKAQCCLKTPEFRIQKTTCKQRQERDFVTQVAVKI
mmetsp:Transcript_18708/g.42917  ORF Transcript_18708/g.42917 Transcript_18708/m.42917 type:complete len:80 (+) Transcript_18708:441-680(+)